MLSTGRPRVQLTLPGLLGLYFVVLSVSLVVILKKSYLEIFVRIGKFVLDLLFCESLSWPAVYLIPIPFLCLLLVWMEVEALVYMAASASSCG